MDELGDDYTEDEIRLVRIKFISEWQIDLSLVVLIIIRKPGLHNSKSGFLVSVSHSLYRQLSFYFLLLGMRLE